jgi:hypothetical protein
MVQPWVFGERPLPVLEELSAALRDLTSTVLALEESSPELERLVDTVRDAQQRLAATAPADLRPRVGPDPSPDQRVYVDHGRDIGDYNPCFPQYTHVTDVERATAGGEVEFPICYEGPPGIVHGGFLAVFFDSVLQQLNCDLGLAGKTAELSLSFRRPTPLLTRLTWTAERTLEDNRIRSHAALFVGETTLCEAHMLAAKGDLSALPGVSPRRT